MKIKAKWDGEDCFIVDFSDDSSGTYAIAILKDGKIVCDNIMNFSVVDNEYRRG